MDNLQGFFPESDWDNNENTQDEFNIVLHVVKSSVSVCRWFNS